MGWTAGYVSDVEYTAGFYQEQSPVLLDFVCALNSVEPATLGTSFNYFELGFGRGLTVNLLAAANPSGQFFAADFNPAHVAGAIALAEKAELPNLTLLENSFADLARGVTELPKFDYITLHGIYTWVTKENQQHIVNFIERYLKPGGLVYVSYNAMPGWAASLPLQRLLVEYASIFPNRSDVQITEAAAFVKKMVDAEAGYFLTGPSLLKARVDGLATHSRNYLVHEYMHKHWQPLYHADVARDLSEAKLEFAGSAELALAYDNLYLSKENQALVNGLTDPVMRETLKDYFQNTGFRKDVFVRGARRMGSLRRRQILENFGVALLVSYDVVTPKMKVVIGEVTAAEDIFRPICKALSVRPHSLAELASLPELTNRPFEDVVQVAALLTASKQGIVYKIGNAKQQTENARRMNGVVAEYARYGDEFNTLCSPLSGNGNVVSYLARIAFLLITEGVTPDADALAAAAWPLMKEQGRKMLRQGTAVEGEDANIAELKTHMRKVLEIELPIWKKLHML